MSLFTPAQLDKINKSAEKSKQALEKPVATKTRSINAELNRISDEVVQYFKDSPAILITSKSQLHDYISKCIEYGYAGIDTETTGLDRIKDTIVGASLYVPGQPEVYIPSKHLVPIFNQLYKDQLTYEEIGEELQRLVDAKTKMIFANADFDISMIYKDLKVDFSDTCYYDVILAWRCLKEDELDNTLKSLYNKYVLRGKGDPKHFTDFFPVALFPFCKPEIAKLYAANDAKITFELFLWQLPYLTKDNPKCKKANLEKIADLYWNIEIPMIKVCAMLHRRGVYVQKSTAQSLAARYHDKLTAAETKLAEMVQAEIDKSDYSIMINSPFKSGKQFGYNSSKDVKYLCFEILKLEKASSVDKEQLALYNNPVTNQILECRAMQKLVGTYVDKLPKETTSDSRIHAQFKSVGADTGRMSSNSPNLQNIPSHATDIRHMFRATPGYVMMSSDYSQQEPKTLAFVSNDAAMIKAFQEGKDIYATIAALSFNMPYEKCLEFDPDTHEYQAEGKARRGEAKTIVLGVTYGRSTVTIGEQLFGDNPNMTEEDRTKAAQKIYDGVMNSFSGLRDFMLSAQARCAKLGYTETILGRRRHNPDMMLPEFEFKPMQGYVNPDVDPLDISTLENRDAIPQRIVDELTRRFKGYKYWGQIVKATKELADQKIRVINNRNKLQEASRKVVNSIIQGSAAELTKMAILKLEHNERWKEIGGRFIIPVHDELIVEVPIEHREEGEKLLKESMESAGDFLPFPIYCDVTTTYRWYGLEVDNDYVKPTTIDTVEPQEVKWIQYMLFENEYVLPVYKEPDGSKPRGNAAMGINGRRSEELDRAIFDYMNRYRISEAQFLDHIEHLTIYGEVKEV